MFPGQQQNFQENSTTGEDPIILPHDRVGRDFSWLQGSSQKERKEKDIEAEESFLYGNEESRSSEISSGGKHGRAQEAQLSNHTRSGSEQLRKVQRHLQSTSRMASALLDSTECEKIRSILKCLGSEDTARGQALEASFSKGESPGFKGSVGCLLSVESVTPGSCQGGPGGRSTDQKQMHNQNKSVF